MTAHEHNCSDIARELTTWRERLLQVTNRFDEMPSIDKYKMTPQIEGLHILLTELTERITKFEKECPLGWAPEDDEEATFNEPRYRFKEEKGVNQDYDFGG